MLRSKLWFVLAALTAVAPAASAADKAAVPPTKAAVPPAKVVKADPKKMGVEDIRACIRGNFAERGSLRDLLVKATDREGSTHELKMKLYWKPGKDGKARMNLKVLEPKDLRGSSYLLLEQDKGDDVYFFLPANKTVLKVTGNEMARPLWGTDFSYTEIRQVQGLLFDGATKRLPDTTVSDRRAFVLETVTKADTTGYKKVVSYIDQASCTLLKSEFFAKGKSPRKVLEADLSTLLQVDTYWMVLAYTMRNVAEGSHTELTMGDLYLLESRGERMFDPDQFYQVAD